MKIMTRRCVTCGKRGMVEVDEAEGQSFINGVRHIQDAMPTTPAPIREQLMTGTHPACWDKMIAEEEW
jgi:hypothetical protein